MPNGKFCCHADCGAVKAERGIRTVRKLLLPIFLVSVLFLLPFAAVRSAGEGPGAAVESLNAAILQALHSPAASDFKTRVAILRPLMVEAFDYPFMARIAAGRFWKDFSPEQQERYVMLFSDLAIDVAASRFKTQPSARLTVTGGRDGPRGTKLVETTLTLPDKTPRVISYLMREDDNDRWRAIDIFFESRISELSTKRSEYTSALEREGIPAFLATLQNKHDSYRAED